MEDFLLILGWLLVPVVAVAGHVLGFAKGSAAAKRQRTYDC